MGNLSISSTKYSDMENHVEDVPIDTKNIDSAEDQKETKWLNSNWSLQLGIYKTIPEFKIALDMRAIWTVGEEIESDTNTEIILDNITGWGNDTFRNLLKNMITVKRLGEDAYAEIMRNPETGDLANLKVLDTGRMIQVYNNKGILLRYEYLSKKQGKSQIFKPTEIFHLTNKRIGNEIHGTSDSEALQPILEANKESFKDMRMLMHRYVKPIMKFSLDTDDESKINAFIAKMDHVVNKGENIYIPQKAVEQELISVPANATLNPMPWRDHLRNYFYQVAGMPQIVMGGSGEFTESTAKIAYLAFEISVKDEQTDLMEQVWDQLGLRIKLKFTKSLMNDLITDEKKDKDQGREFQKNDVSIGGLNGS